jgi:histone H3/H4
LGDRAFSLYDMEEFLKEAGAERVTEDAVLNLERELEKLTQSVANKALRYAAHAGRRKLINKNDVMLTRNGPGAVNYRKPSAHGRTLLKRKTAAASAVFVSR